MNLVSRSDPEGEGLVVLDATKLGVPAAKTGRQRLSKGSNADHGTRRPSRSHLTTAVRSLATGMRTGRRLS